MPYIRCEKCRHEQHVQHVMLGLEVECANCGREYIARETDGAEPEPLVHAESPFGERPALNLFKSACLTLALVAVVGVVFYGIVSLIRPASKAPEKPVAAPVAAGKNAIPRDEPERVNNRAVAADQVDDMNRNLKRAVLSWTFIALVLFYAGYLGLIWYAGYWMAGDTAARGYTPLVWLGTYSVSQLFGRGVGYSLFAVCYYSPLEAALLAALLSFALSELFSWSAFFVWLKIRQVGKIEYCPRCRRGKMVFMPKCPTCGRGS